MNLAVIGSGFVGLTTGACLAELGHDVVCMDTDQCKIAALRSGTVPFYEPGLPELVRRNLDAGRLRFTTDITVAIRQAQIAFLCVGTPSRRDGSADLSMLMEAAEAIGSTMNQSLVVVQKSTAPVGTLGRMAAAVRVQLESRAQDIPLAVVCNPEFLREGTAVHDFLHPDRVVIGGADPAATGLVASLYAPLIPPERIFRMDGAAAEMAKYAANAFLAARISLINEIANLCEELGADVQAVCQSMGVDPRIGSLFLSPGVGYGGSCFPKDVRALIHTGLQAGYVPEILQAVDRVNTAQRRRLASRIAATLSGHPKGPLSGQRVAIWGLSFKVGTDDMRDAPAVTLVNELLRRGARVRAYDPVAIPNARAIWDGAVEYAADPYACAVGADALVLVTEWPEFAGLDLLQVRKQMAGPMVFDARNALDPEAVRQAGLTYHGIGRPQTLSRIGHSSQLPRSAMRILVTGGAGFIGSNLCGRLVSEGHSVFCLDNFQTGQRRNIEHLLASPNFELISGDVRTPLSVSVDRIYHLACPASPPHYQADPIGTLETNVLGTRQMLKLAQQSGARMLLASTSEVYGDPLVHPQPETYWGNVNPIGPRSCYDEGKRAAEALVSDYRRLRHVDARIVRIFNTYGPNMDPQDGRVISNFIVQALAGAPLTIYGDGSQTRSFCYVDDLVTGLILAMEKEKLWGPVNLGNPYEITVSELAAKVLDLVKSDSRVMFRPLPTDDPTRRKPDIQLAVRELGWCPEVSLDKGLAATVAYFRQRLAPTSGDGSPREGEVYGSGVVSPTS